jgi:hypothetical protein
MNQKQQRALSLFQEAITAMTQTGILRSHRYLGDIGEFLCATEFGIDLVTNLRETGHDGFLESRRVQVKYHGGKSTTVNLGKPTDYEEVFVVLGPDSVMRPTDQSAHFLVYRVSASDVSAFVSPKGKHFCTKHRLKSCPVHPIDFNGTKGEVDAPKRP